MPQQDFPLLYGKSSAGKLKQWFVRAVSNENEAFIETQHGYVDGKLQTTRKAVKPKNVGKANETTPFQQACLEAESNWKKKFDQNYRETFEELETAISLLPMLALKFTERKHNVRWPAFAQPKLNGVRCLAKRISENEVEYTSRKAKKWETLDYLTPYICKMIPIDGVLDGEIFNPNLTFQEIMKRVKRVKASRDDIEHDPVQYWVYDCILPEDPFKTRFDALKDTYADVIQYFGSTDLPITLTETVLVSNEQDFEKWHSHWAALGFEGAMLRNLHGMYRLDYRSTDLLKYKHFVDEEFPIVGGHEGSGKDEGTVIFECITKDNKVFSVRPKGTWADRKYWWDHLEEQKGKLLTVRYQNYSDEGVPIFPVGVAIRDYE